MKIASRLTLLILAAAVALLLVHSPFATNDGPVHVAFAHLIASHGDPQAPLQGATYLLDLRPTPNLISYFILVPLMKFASPQAAESLLQLLCIMGPVLAGWVVIGLLDPRNEFLALALFPLSLNQMFFLGLYNYSLSIAAFFIAIALYLRLEDRPSARRAAALAASLLLAFFCHAAGFIMAVVGIASLAGTKAAFGLARGESPGLAAWRQRHVLISLLAPLPAGLLFASATAGTPTDFGSSLASRIEQFGDLYALAVSPGISRYVALGLRTALAFGAFWALARLLASGRGGSRPPGFERSVAILAAAASAFLVMLFIPDTLGGGWTHFRRMVVFPYIWVVLLLASMPIPRVAGIASLALATLASGAALASAVRVQRVVERQMAPIAEVDRRIGAHCTVAPLILETHPVDASHEPIALTFNPYFQAASRLELKHDRVVLFNFLARLDVYPVRFRPEAEPQEHLFGWRPYQHRTAPEEIDIGNYERISGMRVDYLLVWGKPDYPVPLLMRQIDAETYRSRLVYQSPDGWVSLYRRPWKAGDRCRPEP